MSDLVQVHAAALDRRLELTRHMLSAVLGDGSLLLATFVAVDLDSVLGAAGAAALLAATGRPFTRADLDALADAGPHDTVVVPGRARWETSVLAALARVADRGARVIVLPSGWSASPRELELLARANVLAFAAHPAAFWALRSHVPCGLALDPLYPAIAEAARDQALRGSSTDERAFLASDRASQTAFDLSTWCGTVAGAARVTTDIPRVAVAATLIGTPITTPDEPGAELLAQLDYAFRTTGGAHAILGVEPALRGEPAGGAVE